MSRPKHQDARSPGEGAGIRVSAMILVGGASRRMGRDKASLEFIANGQRCSLLSWIAYRCRALGCARVIVVDRKERRDGGAIPGFGASAPEWLSWAQDAPAYVGQGPLAGLLGGLLADVGRDLGPGSSGDDDDGQALRESWIWLLACDEPELHEGDLEPLRQCAQDLARQDRSLAPMVDGVGWAQAPLQPFGTLLRADAVRERCDALLAGQERRLRALFEVLTLHWLPGSQRSSPSFSSINDPESWHQWLRARAFEAIEP